MKHVIQAVFVTALSWTAALAQPALTKGSSTGSLLIVGGGKIGPEITAKFLELAGGVDAPVVVIPTAGDPDQFPPDYLEKTFLHAAGMTHLTLLHTRDRAVADSAEFVAPLRQARAVWFPGGRQWRLADAYLGTRTQREIEAVLARGGMVGGTSAGATIIGSYLVRGAVEGNTVMMSPGHEQGFGLLQNAAIDQHLLVRKRERDMLEVIAAHPELLGIGIDESTAVVVRGDRFEVVGPSKVAVYDRRYRPSPDGRPYLLLSAGAVYDVKLRRVVQ